MELPPIHHIGYVVDDLHTDVPRFAAATGAGPFFAMEHIPFDAVSYHGAPAVYDHSSAFGQWGPILVELTAVHAAEPPAFRDALVRPHAGVGHVAWLADDLAAETARLAGHGLLPFHTGDSGPASAVWFDATALLGHPVEVLARRDELLGFYAMVAAAADGWDHRAPLRILDGPPA